MYCKKCGTLLREERNFCSNCGSNVGANNDDAKNNINVNMAILNNEKKERNFGLYALICGICSIAFSGILGIVLGVAGVILGNKEVTKTTKGKIGTILGVLGIILSILHLCDFRDFFKTLSDNSKINYDEQEISQDDDILNSVKGNYSREVFSGHSFDYQMAYDKAVFTFKTDSTFEVNYISGATYKGTYEVYNGFNISVKVQDIRKDLTIDKNESLANDINDVANKMMAIDILNTYLLWIKTDDGVLQPFMISYNEDTNSGDIVNVYAQSQGNIYLK